MKGKFEPLMDGGASNFAGAEGAAWDVLVVPPKLVMEVERTLSHWISMCLWAYTFASLAQAKNPAVAISADIMFRLRDPVHTLMVTLTLIANAALVYHLAVYERRMRMFGQSDNKYFNRIGIYSTTILLILVVFLAIIADIIYGTTKTVQIAPALNGTAT